LELIIVIIVIGILASIALPRYLKVAEKSRMAEGLSLLEMIRGSQLRYEAATGGFAANETDLDFDYTELKYFGITIAQGTGLNDTIGTVSRIGANDCPTSFCPNGDNVDTYELSITGNGVISCASVGTGVCPQVVF